MISHIDESTLSIICIAIALISLGIAFAVSLQLGGKDGEE